MDFVFNDELTKNEYGFFTKNAGIDTSEFLENPVCLYNHESLPSIGRWKNLRVEGSKYIATLDFDESDSFALSLKNKYANGYMAACSKAIAIDDYESINIDGELIYIVTKSRLKEISLVNVGANPKSLKLSLAEVSKGQVIRLNYNYNFLNQKAKNMKVLSLLGLSSETSEEQLECAINSLIREKANLQEQLEQLKEAIHTERVNNLIHQAVKSQKITVFESEKLRKLALMDYESVKELIDAKEAYVPVSALINNSNNDLHDSRPKEFVRKGKNLQERLAVTLRK